jgi:hypothetical protein
MHSFEKINNSTISSITTRKSIENFSNEYLIKDIDTHNVDTVNSLISKYKYECNGKNKNRKDIVLELYNEGFLTSERLEFIIEKCNPYLYISSSLIKKLINDVKSNNLTETILKNLSIYDNYFIQK